jgi:hypothetical protein
MFSRDTGLSVVDTISNLECDEVVFFKGYLNVIDYIMDYLQEQLTVADIAIFATLYPAFSGKLAIKGNYMWVNKKKWLEMNF